MTSLARRDLMRPLAQSLKVKALSDEHMLAGWQVRERLQVQKRWLDVHRRDGSLLALRTEGWVWRYPDWQFRHAALLPGIAGVREALDAADPWLVWCFFELFHTDLGTTGVKALQAGRVDDLVASAKRFLRPEGIFI